jgi:hypothetical protein
VEALAIEEMPSERPSSWRHQTTRNDSHRFAPRYVSPDA